MEEGIICNGNHRKVRVAILISDIIDFKIKKITKMLNNDQRINPRKRYKIINIYASKTGAPQPQYIRQLLVGLKGEINSNTIKVRDFNTPFT